MFDIEEIISGNSFSQLHDGEKVFFCKFEYINHAWEQIRNKDHECILISGNSDYGHTQDLVEHPDRPPNLKTWFTSNKSYDGEGCRVLPWGVQNFTPNKLGKKHGVILPYAPQKMRDLANIDCSVETTSMIYANFTIDQIRHPSRIRWREIANAADHITWEQQKMHQEKSHIYYLQNQNKYFFERITQHEAVLCPQGNIKVPEGDNHRIYEVLYCGRIPITHAEHYYRRLHHLFPIILIPENELDLIADEEYMRSEIDRVKAKTFDPKFITASYWHNVIREAREELM
jgi:hypothetical protein